MAETLFHCDDVLWRRFEMLCRARDETPGAVLRDLVRLEVQRCERRKARSAEGFDEPPAQRASTRSSTGRAATQPSAWPWRRLASSWSTRSG